MFCPFLFHKNIHNQYQIEYFRFQFTISRSVVNFTQQRAKKKRVQTRQQTQKRHKTKPLKEAKHCTKQHVIFQFQNRSNKIQSNKPNNKKRKAKPFNTFHTKANEKKQKTKQKKSKQTKTNQLQYIFNISFVAHKYTHTQPH